MQAQGLRLTLMLTTPKHAPLKNPEEAIHQRCGPNTGLSRSAVKMNFWLINNVNPANWYVVSEGKDTAWIPIRDIKFMGIHLKHMKGQPYEPLNSAKRRRIENTAQPMPHPPPPSTLADIQTPTQPMTLQPIMMPMLPPMMPPYQYPMHNPMLHMPTLTSQAISSTHPRPSYFPHVYSTQALPAQPSRFPSCRTHFPTSSHLGQTKQPLTITKNCPNRR